jgi:hypothetical protein
VVGVVGGERAQLAQPFLAVARGEERLPEDIARVGYEAMARILGGKGAEKRDRFVRPLEIDERARQVECRRRRRPMLGVGEE